MTPRRSGRLLLTGTAAGIALAAISLLGTPTPPVPADAIAVVNGKAISRDAFERLARAAASAAQTPELTPAQRRELLTRLVDEELLVQRGLELGLARIDPKARQAVQAVMRLVLTGAAAGDAPDEETLRRYHATHAERFRESDRLVLEGALARVDPLSESEAYRRAAELARVARDRGPLLDRAREAGGFEPWQPRALTLDEIEERRGDKVARIASILEPGEIGPPLRTTDGWLVLTLTGRRPGRPMPFEEARDRVRVELLPAAELHAQPGVPLRRAEAVDAGHGGHHDDVLPREERAHGGEAEPLDLAR